MTNSDRLESAILQVNTRYYRVREWTANGVETDRLSVNDWDWEGERTFSYDELGQLLLDSSAPTARFHDGLSQEVR